MPTDGYSTLFNNMINNNNIQIYLNTTFNQQQYLNKYDIIIYTGRIDQFFNNCYYKLQYRSVRFQYQLIDQDIYQPACVINYPDINIPYTRIIQLKHATKIKSNNTLIIKQYSSDSGFDAYVVNNKYNTKILNKYKQLSTKYNNVYFTGRLAQYKYYNMDQAILSAINLTTKINNKE